MTFVQTLEAILREQKTGPGRIAGAHWFSAREVEKDHHRKLKNLRDQLQAFKVEMSNVQDIDRIHHSYMVGVLDRSVHQGDCRGVRSSGTACMDNELH